MVDTIRPLLTLFKLRIGLTIVLTALAGMAVTPGPAPAPWQIAILSLGVLLAAAASGGFNHYFDCDIDARMQRTRNRPFVTGQLRRSTGWLIFFGLLLLVPCLLVGWTINGPSGLFVFLGAFFYGGVYTLWLKRRTWLNIVVGGAAGSFAILAGAAAVDPALGPLPLSLALVLFLWTPPHFWSLAIALRSDYHAAGVPMLPVLVGDVVTARVILGHTLVLMLASLLPYAYGLGPLYLAGALAGGALFLYRSLRLVARPDPVTARANFRASIQQLALVLGGAALDQWISRS
ncbi:MAG: protoheme IX farnesyltransferase [Magnetococcales bacterium]|nr:protoheme IX farnesyltransferase [Magnetococcales bacterium]